MSLINKDRFVNIDALRGIAAFLVVIFHLFGIKQTYASFLAPEKISLLNIIYFIPAYGYIGVYLFFVISGFCIHLRWSKSRLNKTERNKVNFISFWKRRWIRLYPAYLAAMLLFIIWEYTQGKLLFGTYFFFWDIISHILMIHNLDNRTVYSMNGVFWTLAIEEQLYLLYFLLLWLRRKFGWIKTLTITFAARFIWLGFILLFNRFKILEIPFGEGALANWWIWSLGAMAIENYFGIIKFPRWCYSLIISTAFLAVGVFIRYISMLYPDSHSLSQLVWIVEPTMWGAGFFFMINYVMQYEKSRKKSSLSYYAVSFWAMIGLFSYSLYLTHEFVLEYFSGVFGLWLVALTLIFAYLFFLIFEKPFMRYLSLNKN